MKNLMTIVLTTLVSTSSFAAIIKSAKLDAAQKNLLIDVVYGGGCGKHDFSLKVGGCLESFPPQCAAELIHVTDDHCEAMIHKTVSLPLRTAKMTLPATILRKPALVYLERHFGKQAKNQVPLFFYHNSIILRCFLKKAPWLYLSLDPQISDY